MIDETKISASSAFNSIKNYENPAELTATFSGTIGSFSSITRTSNFVFTRSEGTIPLILLNYAGSPNNSGDWFVAGTAPALGFVTLDGGWGTEAIVINFAYNSTGLTITQTIYNNDFVGHNIVTSVTCTMRVALYVVPFN